MSNPTNVTEAHVEPMRPEPVHPAIVRATHWVNALAILVMIGSGWQIYNAHPILPFTFPTWITLGGWLGGALLWHFAFMWLLVGNGLAMLGFGLFSGRYRRKFLPIHPRAVVADIRDALGGKLAHDDLASYNAVQKLFYVGVIAAAVVVVASGLAIWKPVQLQGLVTLFGGFDVARIVHFAAMSAIVGFLVVHVIMALLVPKTIRAMILGR
eukprot:gene27264-30098_t